jgi:EAL domain-containing protein (putative c-di-GMP-specific phosphodiesterase class I)
MGNHEATLRIPATGPGVEAGSAVGQILIVDDEPALRRAIGRLLSDHGYEASLAGDGREAMAFLERRRFDLIVSDILMPGMDGIELLRKVRDSDPDVPVVLLTGDPEVRTAQSAVNFGAYRYLTKPFRPEEMVEVVAKAVTLGRMARLKREAQDLSGEGLGASDRAGLEASFGRALEGMWMAYQPIVRAKDKSLLGFEALMRTVEPSLPHPGAMLDAAERLGRLALLGRRARELAAVPMAERADESLLFVNLHPRDLSDDSLLSETAPLSSIASRVVLEVTERASLGGVPDLEKRLASLRAMGYRLAVDDLGAGYAGLTSFAQLEPEVVKLDMSLVRDVHRSETKRRVIRSMTALCHDLGMMTVAEGVETADERDVLVDLGCDLLQGYFLAKPGKPFPEFSWG